MTSRGGGARAEVDKPQGEWYSRSLRRDSIGVRRLVATRRAHIRGIESQLQSSVVTQKQHPDNSAEVLRLRAEIDTVIPGSDR